jgi:hypothetical protein
MSYRISARKKYSNIGRYPGKGNRYPPGHEHGYHAGIEGCMFAPPNFQLKIQKIIHSTRTNKSIEVTKISKTTPFCGRFSMQSKLLQLTAFKWVLLQSSKLLRLEDLGSFLRQFFVIVLCLGFAMDLGLCSRVEVQKNCGKLSWIGYWGFRLGFRKKAYTCWSTLPDSVPTSFFYCELLRSSGERKPLYWATIPLGFW